MMINSVMDVIVTVLGILITGFYSIKLKNWIKSWIFVCGTVKIIKNGVNW